MISWKSIRAQKAGPGLSGGMMTLENPRDWISGDSEAICPESALKLPAVYRCIAVLSDSIGEMPVSVKNWTTREDFNDHYLGKVLWQRPNEAMLVPDLSGNFDKFKGRPVVCADNDEIGTVTKDTKVYDPLFVGNLKAAVSVFIRKTVEVAATDVGGDAWANDAYELRCLCRMDAQSVDSEAVVFTGYAQA